MFPPGNQPNAAAWCGWAFDIIFAEKRVATHSSVAQWQSIRLLTEGL